MKYCYDTECHNLAIYFFGEHDPRLAEIAQAIQDCVEDFPAPDAEYVVFADQCRHQTERSDCPVCKAIASQSDAMREARCSCNLQNEPDATKHAAYCAFTNGAVGSGETKP